MKQSDNRAIDWLIRLEIAANSETDAAARQQTREEFYRWATLSAANVTSFLEVACIYEAIGEFEHEKIGELVAYVDGQGNITELGPPTAPELPPPESKEQRSRS